MNRKNTAFGVILILLGIAIYLRNFHIGTGSLITLVIGLGLLYGYYARREQPFIIFGGIFTTIGLAAILGDINLFRMDMTFESILIALGLIFIFIFYTKHMDGFIFPGTILISIGTYLILMRSFSDWLAGPSIFLLLGFAFYSIYFMAYIGKSNWPLIPATILLLLGILSYAFTFEVVTWNMFFLNWNYIWPLLMVTAGIAILISRLRGRS